MKDKEFRKTNEFRFRHKRNNDPSSGHPEHINEKSSTHVKAIQTTHSSHINGVPNIEMHKNPNPNDTSKAYFVPKQKIRKLNMYGRPGDGWTLSEEDDKEMDKYRDK